MISEEEIIKGCKEYKESAQKTLFYKYAPVLKSICLRYSSNIEEAEDTLQEGFIKIFDKINKYKGNGSFEGWMKRIMINTAISNYKKSKKESFEKIEGLNINDSIYYAENEGEDLEGLHFSDEELDKALKALPDQLRVVFNLYYLDDNSHKEIGQLLKIDERASRTRLSRARKFLRNFLLSTKKEKTSVRLNKIG